MGYLGTTAATHTVQILIGQPDTLDTDRERADIEDFGQGGQGIRYICAIFYIHISLTRPNAYT